MWGFLVSIIILFILLGFNALWLILIIAAIVILIIVLFDKNRKDVSQANKQRLDSLFATYSDFKVTQKVVSSDNFFLLAVDDLSKKILLIKGGMCKEFKYKDILSVEVLQNSKTVSSKSTSRTFGGALVGGALAGGAGAVVGGLSGDVISKDVVTLLTVKIITRNIEDPVVTLLFYSEDGNRLKGEIEKEGYGSPTYELGLDKALLVKDLLSVVIDQVDLEYKESRDKEHKQSSSGLIADEIAKLYQLLQQGAISSTEYTEMKKELLSSLKR